MEIHNLHDIWILIKISVKVIFAVLKVVVTLPYLIYPYIKEGVPIPSEFLIIHYTVNDTVIIGSIGITTLTISCILFYSLIFYIIKCILKK